MNDKKRTISELLSNIFIVLALVYLIIYYSSFFLVGECSIFGYKIFRVASPSMEPTLMTGDFILMKIVDEDEIETGDIIGYDPLEKYQKDKIIVHRLIRKENNAYIVKGDNNSTEDDPVDGKQIHYKLVCDFFRKI